MSALNLVFILVLATFLIVASTGFIIILLSAHKDRAVKRQLALRFYPDAQGNYPQELLPDGTVTNFQPGNSRYQATSHYIIQPHKSEVIPALPAQPEVRWKVFGNEVEPEIPALPTSQEEVIAYLVDAKKRGLSKTEALKSIGITGGRSFTKFAKHFDTLP